MVLSFSWRGPRPGYEDHGLAVNTGYLPSLLCRQGRHPPKENGRIVGGLIASRHEGTNGLLSEAEHLPCLRVANGPLALVGLGDRLPTGVWRRR